MNLAACEGKVAVVTGGSKGLGLGLVEYFLEQGMRVAACSRSTIPLPKREELYTECFDIKDSAALESFAQATVQRFGDIDVWVNNAGVLEPVEFVRDLKQSEFFEHLSVNIGGVFAGSQVYINHRRASSGGGVLINISSGAALKGYAAWGAYCAGKAALDRLSECIQLEEAETGLRVHAVAPGVIDTNMQSTIRGLTVEQFPMVEKFHEIKRNDAFNTPRFVAQRLLEIAFDKTAAPDTVVVRLANEK